MLAQTTDNFSRTFRISKGSDSGIKKGMPVVVGVNTRAALVGQVFSVSKTAAIIRRIDDRQFGTGAQLVQPQGVGPKGTAVGQPDSSLLRFSVIDASGTAVAMKKGEVAVTLGSFLEPYPPGLVIGTVVRSVEAGGAIARDAELRPVVDLDALDVVKVLKYPPAAP